MTARPRLQFPDQDSKGGASAPPAALPLGGPAAKAIPTVGAGVGAAIGHAINVKFAIPEPWSAVVVTSLAALTTAIAHALASWFGILL
jgi:hypothetical protein